MRPETVPSSYEYQKQRTDLRVALLAFESDGDIPIDRNGFTGNVGYVADRNEWWFETWTRWEDQTEPRIAWARIDLQQRKFDEQYGSADPAAAYGYRQAATLADAIAGNED